MFSLKDQSIVLKQDNGGRGGVWEAKMAIDLREAGMSPVLSNAQRTSVD